MGLGIWSLSLRLAPKLTDVSTSSESDAIPLVLEKSVAVLPFENLSEDKESAFFAEGVQDDILTALSKVAAFKVTSRTSVNTYPPGKRRNLSEIAQTLGVAYILEGSVRRDNEKAHDHRSADRRANRRPDVDTEL